MLLEPVYKVRIVYKGGTTMDFECTNFTIDKSNNSMS